MTVVKKFNKVIFKIKTFKKKTKTKKKSIEKVGN